MPKFTWTERKKKGPGRLTLQDKFTSNELILMRVIFENEMTKTDAYHDSPFFDCCTLKQAINSWSGTPYNLAMDALIYLGYLTEQGEISDFKLNGRYFSKGPVVGSSQHECSPDGTKIYVTKAGYNLVKQVVGIFYIQEHLAFTFITKTTTL